MGFVKNMLANNFIEYASYVIKERAIPDITDGLKPVQRRILHSLYEMDDGRFHKVANVVGHTMKYHPHGDASIFSSLVVLANKELFIDKQGNFGNIYTGDEASAARYIECKISELAKEVLFNPDITEYIDSYDARNKEPLVLPAKIPVLLLMGAEGIAVGMSTKILPHNLNELIEAQIKILKGEKFEVYPDFPQGGLLDISEYNKGNGKVTIQALIEIKDNKTLVIKEIPYGTTTQSLIASIENGVKKGKIKLSSIHDYTAENVEIELKVARGEASEEILKQLYAFSDCQITTNVSLVVIIDNRPKFLTVNEVLFYNTKKLIEYLTKELKLEKNKLLQKLHDLTLEQIFLENRIYKKIEEIETYEEMVKVVEENMNKYKKFFIRELTIDDIEKLLQIKIRRISRYDIERYKKEKEDIIKQLKIIEKKLLDVKGYAIEYLKNIKEKYGRKFTRKTKIVTIKPIDIKEINRNEIKVYWDKEKGFLGTEVKGEISFTANEYDKFIVINNDLTYKIIPIESKIFVDTNVAFLDLFDEKRIFSLIYTDLDSVTSYAKKFQIKKFIANKLYTLSPFKKAKINFISTDPNAMVEINFVKKKRLKVTKIYFKFRQIDIKNVSSKGNKITSKEIEKIISK